jgi:hypothetical protein
MIAVIQLIATANLTQAKTVINILSGKKKRADKRTVIA